MNDERSETGVKSLLRHVSRLAGHVKVKFLLAGGLNTLASLAIYWLLLEILDYRTAYTASYIIGIGLSYLLNTYFVFNTRPSAGTAIAYPAIYLIQYVAGIALLWLWVERLGLSAELGAMMVVVATLPITFVLTRFLLKRA